MRSLAAVSVGAMLLSGVAQSQEYGPGFGPNPQLPQAEQSLIPTVNIAIHAGFMCYRTATRS